MLISGIFAALFATTFTNPATPHCIYEDASELTKVGQTCKWDASEDGINGVGDSYVVILSESGKLFVYADGTVER